MENQKTFQVFDGHSDILDIIAKEGLNFMDPKCPSQFNYHSALRGNFIGAFFSVFFHVTDDQEENQRRALIQINHLYKLLRANHEVLNLVRSKATYNPEKFNIIGHLEGPEVIDPEFKFLDFIYSMGFRSLGLAWNRAGIYGQGIGRQDTGQGLTDLGKKLLKKLYSMNMIVDVSHLNEAGFGDVIENAEGVVVATHSNCRSLCDHPRNLHDKQMKAIAETGGVVSLNFCKCFLKVASSESTVDDVVNHLLHAVEIAGINHVALGSDYDACDIPESIDNAEKIQYLFNKMSDKGFNEEDIKKIASANWLRVINEVLK